MTMKEFIAQCPEYCSNKTDTLMLCIAKVFPDYYYKMPVARYTYGMLCDIIEELGVTEVE